MAAALSVGCGSGGERTASTEQGLAVHLQPLANCNEVEAYVRQAALADMNKQIDDALASALKGDNSNCAYEDGAAAGGSSNGGSGGSTPPAAPSGNDKATSASGTNNQVVGVDEADFVKNDTKYVYVVSDGAFRIIDAWPASQAHEIAKFPISGTPTKLFVDGDRALIYASLPQPTSSTGTASSPTYPGGGGSSSCTYGYECSFDGDGTQTQVTVLDIANRAAPASVRQINFSGSLIAARRVGHAVHTVVSSLPIQFTGLSYQPETTSQCGPAPTTPLERQTLIQAYEDLRAKNRQIIVNADISGALPSITDAHGGSQSSVLAQCGGFYRSSQSDGASFTSVVSIDMQQDGVAPTASTIVSRAGAVYASAASLYIAVPHDRPDQGDWYYGMDTDKQASTVHAFRIGETPGQTGYAASGVVKGAVLNQFSMDEFEGHLRIATTSGHDPDPDVNSTLTVLEPHGANLDAVGKITGIAPHEDIRSVRFDGPKGYVVTFKKTDPLYVYDLSVANAPHETGELQIPGFSTYMHMIDDTHLLTIGYDADDQGSFAWFAGVRLQIFDVTNPQSPQLLHAEVIGTRGSSSEALTNHLAFNYYAPKGILALPMTVCEGGSGGSYGTNMTFSGLMVYDVSVQNGFHLRGKVSHPTPANQSQGGYDSVCTNWWTNASSEVKRSIVMDNVVFSVSSSLMKANDLDNLPQDISQVSLTQ